jgi:hypothetical protein
MLQQTQRSATEGILAMVLKRGWELAVGPLSGAYYRRRVEPAQPRSTAHRLTAPD